MPHSHDRLRALAAARWRIAVALTCAMIFIYFGFIALIAFDRQLLATMLAPGVSLGIVLGALVIVASWLLTFIYVRWSNVHYDAEVLALQTAAAAKRDEP